MKTGQTNYGPLLIVAPEDSIAGWKKCAELEGKSIIEWCVEQLDTVAMARLIEELRGVP